MSPAIASALSTISRGGERRVLDQRARRGLRVGSAGADREDAVLGLEHVALPVTMSERSLSATASIASSRRSTRSVRQSLASSTAARIRLPWCLSSLASKRSNRVKASAVPPAKPARMRSWYRRRTLRAPPFKTTLPSVTCPSPPSATLAPRRTERIVVPCSCSMESSKWGRAALTSRSGRAKRPGATWWEPLPSGGRTRRWDRL